MSARLVVPTRLAVVIAAIVVAGGARADETPAPAPAPADTALHRYFGLTAQPADTAGLDSTLAARLERPWRSGRGPRRVGLAPSYTFDRANGSTVSGRAIVSDRDAHVMLTGDGAYATGPREWLGGGELSWWRRRSGTITRLELSGGWRTGTIDRDFPDPQLAMVRAFVNGSDRQHYLRREGFRVRASARRSDLFAAFAYEDWFESPLTVTSYWNLLKRPLVVPYNIPAASGRMRGFSTELGARLPRLPVRAGLDFDLASRPLGGDFDYGRLRLSLAGEFPILGFLSLLPQMRYGLLEGDAVPQAAFYLGGPRSLRSLYTNSRAGTGLAIARLDVVQGGDLLALLHLPHPAMLPLQAGAFVASGAVWGADPFHVHSTLRGEWPARDAWLSEAGVSLLYRPGIPDDDGYFRIDHAWRLGPGPPSIGWTVSYSRMFDLVPGF
jgi:hypothetical protein